MSFQRWMPRSVAAGLVMQLWACSGGGPSAAEFEDVPAWELERLHEIGSVADPDELLTTPSDIALAPDGRLYVGQPEDGYIRVHLPDGSPAGIVGRRGEGPGEFGRVGSINSDTSGIWVHDSANQRMHRFDLEGAFLADERWPNVPELRHPVVLAYGQGAISRGPNGHALAQPGVARLSGGADLDTLPVPIRVFGPGGELGEVILTVSGLFRSGAPEGWLAPLSEAPLVRLMRGGAGVAWVERRSSADTGPTTFVVGRVDAEGDTLFLRTYDYEPRPAASDEIADAWLASLDDAQRAQFSGRIWVPETLPAVSELVAASGGTIWIAREEREPARLWWALDPETGDVEGAVSLPADELVADSRGDDLVTIRTDELDVPYVRRYRILR